MAGLVERGGSDLHLTGDTPPYYRVQGSIVPVSDEIYNEEDLNNDLMLLLGKDKLEKIFSDKELDCSYSLENVARFRINVFFDRGRISAVMRALSSNIPTFNQLGLPSSVQQLLNRPRGLMLVTGPTGSGKTTTLASSIDWINENKPHHILTIEDPIEFVYSNKNCLIRQREVGEDTNSFSKALRSALREDPDIILVGEMRDLETISLAITAAETGHLVLGTLHTSSAAKTVERIVDVFPGDQQEQARLQVSTSLLGVMTQTLCKNIKGKRSLAYEMMINTPAIANLIRERKISQIYSQLQTGSKDGMNTLEQCLKRLVEQGEISQKEALSKASNPKALFGNES